MTNKNSGEAYTANDIANISKIAAQLAADGGVSMTDRATDAASFSGVKVEIYLSGGQICFANTTTGQVSAGLAFATVV